MINIILFGPPGSGKGTQAELLIKAYGLEHISTGDLFRHNLKNNTPLGQEARVHMDQGHLVPDEVTIKMLKQRVHDSPDATGFIFDGFPRTIPQADALMELMKEENSDIHALIKLEVSRQAIIERLLERGKTSGRVDDQNEETISKRIDVYLEETSPVFQYFADLDRSYSVNGLGSIEEISHRLSSVIDHLYAIHTTEGGQTLNA
jgi:adenylate kinase